MKYAHYFKTTILLVAAVVLVGFKPAPPPKTIRPQAVRPQAATAPKMDQQMARMMAAQQWLKSIGYDLTFDQMKTLKRLNLQKYSIAIQAQITDENMRHVEVLTNLEILQIPRKIGDDGLKHVAGLTRLKSLNMPQCRVTDAGMQYLNNLMQIESLVMAGLDITDAGLQQIKHLGPLIINLNNTKVTDAGVSDWLQGKYVKNLFLTRTGVTDAVIPAIKQVKYLERVDIQGTNITPQGYQDLKAALPGVTIHYP